MWDGGPTDGHDHLTGLAIRTQHHGAEVQHSTPDGPTDDNEYRARHNGADGDLGLTGCGGSLCSGLGLLRGQLSDTLAD